MPKKQRNRRNSKIKYCFKCGVILDKNNWYAGDKNFKTPRYRCKICSDFYKKWQRGIDKNFTPVDYNKMFDKQSGCCALCGKHQSELKKGLGIDHNHITKQVRKLLCNNCNLGLGNFNIDLLGIELLEKAIKYTKETVND